MADQTDQSQEDQGQTPKPEEQEETKDNTVNYLGRELTSEQLLEETRKKDAELTRLYQERKSAEQESDPEPETYVPEDQKAQLEQVRQTLDQLGYADKKSIKELVDQELAQRDQVNRMQSKAEQLSSKYNGKGDFKDYPKFDEQEILKYSQEKGILDPEVAYESMHRGKIIDAEIKRANEKKAAAGDQSDAPREEPIDRDAAIKKLEEAQGSPNKIAQVLQDAGLGTPPPKRN